MLRILYFIGRIYRRCVIPAGREMAIPEPQTGDRATEGGLQLILGAPGLSQEALTFQLLVKEHFRHQRNASDKSPR